MSLVVNKNGWSRCGKGAGLDLNEKERRREERGFYGPEALAPPRVVTGG